MSDGRVLNENLREGLAHINDNEAIGKTESERDQVRNRPSIYFGTNDLKGCARGAVELITNGIDEVRSGFGDMVTLEISDDYTITVMDNGRGVPMDFNAKAKKFNWDLVYNQMFASGKSKGGAYRNAAGLNGVGASITQFTSLWMKVISRRIEENGNKIEYEMNFENGYPKGELIKREWTGNTTGTIVSYKADGTVFQETEVTKEIFIPMLLRLAMITPKCHLIIKYMDEPEIDFFFENGPETYLEELVEDRLTKRVIAFNRTYTGMDSNTIKLFPNGYPVEASVAFTFSVGGHSSECFHNGAHLIDGGTHYEGFKIALKDFIEKQAKLKGKIESKEKILVADVESILNCIIQSSFEGDCSAFDGQDKKAILNKHLAQGFYNMTLDGLNEWATLHKEELDKIVDLIVAIKNTREQADMVRKKVLKKLSTPMNSWKDKPDCLKDCKSKDTDENEVYFVEGDSAAGSAELARNPRTQAIMALTGKTLNCLKKDYNTILSNKVILNICQILGCGVEIHDEMFKDIPKYDSSKLRYGKFVICTDADLDGLHIRCLLLMFLYKMMPSLIKENRVYIAEAPLFQISYAKQNVYAYSDEERDTIVNGLIERGAKEKSISITRYKGLGEMSDFQMAESVMNVNTRRLTLVEYPEDEKEFATIANELLGDDINGRKRWMYEYFENKKAEEENEDNVEDAFYGEESYESDEEGLYED